MSYKQLSCKHCKTNHIPLGFVCMHTKDSLLFCNFSWNAHCNSFSTNSKSHKKAKVNIVHEKVNGKEQCGGGNSQYESKVFPLFNQAPCHEGLWRSGSTVPHILNPVNIWRWVVSPAILPMANKPPSTQWIGSWVGISHGLDDFEAQINFLPLLGVKPQCLSCPAHSLVAILTTLSWLLV